VTEVLDPLATGPLDDDVAGGAPAESASVSITPREVWRRARLPVMIGVLFVSLAIVQMIMTRVRPGGYLDPDSTSRAGAGALTALLRDHGVDVRVVDAPSESAGVTVFVPIPELLAPDVLAGLTEPADVVLVEPTESYLAATASGVEIRDDRAVDVLKRGCEHPDAVAAGDVRLGGFVFDPPEGATACYRATFVEVERGGQRTTYLGSGDLFTNEHLDEDGNAALALRLLTRNPTVEWVYPDSLPGTGADGTEEQGLTDLLPHWVFLVIAQLGVLVLALVAWRSRRLGPVVVEPLPVVVRATEAVEGRARLYQSARALDSAAESLRAGMRDRLVRALGLPADAPPSAVIDAVTPRMRTLDREGVQNLLYGRPPADDVALVLLADDLDSLYSEVRDL
jgi:hypothetical protein